MARKKTKRQILSSAYTEFVPWVGESGSEPQREFLDSDAYITCFVGGIGTGKSTVGGAWALDMIFKYPQADGMICANNISQLKNATLKSMRMFLDELSRQHGQPIYKIDQHNTLQILLSGHESQKIHLKSLDKGAGDIEGFEVAWAWLDEAEATPPDSFDVLTDRLRQKVNRHTGEAYGALTPLETIKKLEKSNSLIPNQIKITTTPDKLGAKWLYDLIYDADKIQRREELGVKLTEIKAKTLDNPYLTEQKKAEYQSKYTGSLAKQQLEGEWTIVADGDAVYFNDFHNGFHIIDAVYDPRKTLILGLDWGSVNPACIFAQEGELGQLIVLAEYYDQRAILKDFINNILDIIAYRFPENLSSFEAYCDPAGRVANEQTGESNIDVFHQMTGIKPYHIPSTPGSVPLGIQLVRERLSSIAKDQRRKLLIDRGCKILIEGFQGGYRYVKNVTSLPVPKIERSEYIHLQDSLRYVVINKYSRTSDQVRGHKKPWKQKKTHNLLQYGR